VTTEELLREWRYRYHEAMAMKLEDSSYETGQRPETPNDKAAARREANEAIAALRKYADQRNRRLASDARH
jgi:hypothetical protein